MAHCSAVEFRNLTKRYPGAQQAAVDQLNLQINAGEICVFVGPSGCGKTTALRMVNRMVEPTSGEVLIDGESVHNCKQTDLRRAIGYVIQQIGLFPHLTVAQNIATVPKLLGWPKQRINQRVAELLEMVSLPPETAVYYPRELSGGQCQRVGVARALAANPPLLLMDEPFGAIDPINRERLQNELLRLQEDLRKTIIFVTHDIDEALKLGDRIAVFEHAGKIAQYTTPEELLLTPASSFVEQFINSARRLQRLELIYEHETEG